ncbi:tail tape measure protein [Croceibacterium ferulae]|uniref:tail tape measure protein n=1 Tax=Croceibacterium ferulae TaxID=1854641 RepID=UPI000EB56170|nr:tail tape measure protein [Croceibacterium ferulae]
MDDDIETLMIDVRANTSGLRADLDGLRGTLDSALGAAGEEAGARLERGLLSAIRRGSLGFDDLKRVALGAMDEIAAGAMQRGVGAVLGGASAGNGGPGGMSGLLAGVAGALLGLPGRATGGPVAPGRPYWVGERGPEVFVPTAAGRIEPATTQPRDVRISIQLQQPRGGGDAPAAWRRSSRQVASSIRRSLRAF